MKSATTNTRWQRTPIRGEAAWIPRSLDDLEDLRRRLTEAGHPSSVVNGITGWLVAKAIGERDHSGGPTRSRYRKILAELGPGPYDGDGGQLSDSGDVDRGTLVGAGLVAMGGMAMATGRPLGAAVAALALAAHNARDESYDAFALGAAA